MALEPLGPADPAEVGAYRLLGRVGRGGMGTVYLALGAGDRAVAVKVLRDGPADAGGRQRFRRELELLRRVRGPHLVEVLDGDAEAPTPWIATRFVPGRRLDELVAGSGPLPRDALVRLGRGVARGLQTLHAAGIVHRDLTPGNVLMVEGEPYVIDLGLAVVADLSALTRTGLVLGTAGYLAPEQVLGTGCAPAADVHAWGATLALAGTGRPAYGTGRPEAVLYRVVHGEPDLDGMPEGLAPVVRAALAKDPAARPTVDDLLAALAPTDRHLVAVSSGPHAVRHGTDELHRPPGDATTVLAPDATTVLRPDATAVLAAAAGSSPADPPGRARSSAHARATRLALGVPALLAAAAASLVAPVLVALAVVAGLLAVQTAVRSAARRRALRELRGSRRGDGALALVGLPLRAAEAVYDLLLGLPVLVVGAGLPALVVGGAVSGRLATAAAVTTGTALSVPVILRRRRWSAARAGIVRRAAGLSVGPRDAAVGAGGLLLLALGLVVVALGGPHWWPLAPRG